VSHDGGGQPAPAITHTPLDAAPAAAGRCDGDDGAASPLPQQPKTAVCRWQLVPRERGKSHVLAAGMVLLSFAQDALPSIQARSREQKKEN
jgi:hypothetical protein